MASKTLTYSEAVNGWVSFYSFDPDWMIGMNNFFYTFKGGNLYRHNSNEVRNTFYQDWWTRKGSSASAFVPSSMQSVLNQAVLENKLFKTIDLQGDSTWNVQLQTDLQNSGFIEAGWFQKKEATFFAFIRNTSDGQLSLRSVNGIGSSSSIIGGTVINFSISPLVSIGSIVSIGDYLYFGSGPLLAGEITAINVDYPSGVNQIVIDNSIPGAQVIPPGNQFFMFVKNSVAESHGVLGHYCKFTMQNSSTTKIELFALESDAMKSFP